MEAFDRMCSMFAPLLGRILIASLFVVIGYGFITNYQVTLSVFQQMHIPMASIALPVALLLKFGGSASLLLGYRTKWGALALFVFTLGATLIAHMNVSDPGQQIMFLKNLAIMGGLLFVYVYGPGPFALDNRKMPKVSPTAAMN